MIRTTRSATVTGTVALLAAITIALTGCTPEHGSPSPSPTATSASPTALTSPTPSVDAAEAARQANIDAAKARYVEYQKVANQVLIAGKASGFDDIQPYLGTPELLKYWQSVPQQYEDQGLKQVGESTIKSMRVTLYGGDPLKSDSTQTVHLEVCTDDTKTDAIRADGSVMGTVNAYPIIYDVTMQTQLSDGRWTLTGLAARQPIEEC